MMQEPQEQQQTQLQAPQFRNQNFSQSLVRQLTRVWIDFEFKLNRVPIIDKINRGRCSREDYKILILNLLQQIPDGALWIARMCSNISMKYFAWRGFLLEHALDGHKDYLLAQSDFLALGGSLAEIENFRKKVGSNIGTEALAAFIVARANEKDPLDLMGAMFIIEGLSSRLCGRWAESLRTSLGLQDHQLQFLLQHAKHEDHDITGPIEQLLSGVDLDEELTRRIVRTARVTARLYLLQLEELEAPV